MEGKRSEKVGDLIQKEISHMLVRSIKDPRIGFVTITRVIVSDDCRFAKLRGEQAGVTQDAPSCRDHSGRVIQKRHIVRSEGARDQQSPV